MKVPLKILIMIFFLKKPIRNCYDKIIFYKIVFLRKIDVSILIEIIINNNYTN